MPETFSIRAFSAIAIVVATATFALNGGLTAHAQTPQRPTQCDSYGNPDLRAQCLNMESRDNSAGHFDPRQRPSQCGGYGNPDLREQCRNMEALTNSTRRGLTARTDLQNSQLRAASRKEDSACAATIKADVAAGRYSEHDVRVVRAGRAWRTVGYCNVLRQLPRK
jgi:hypothetical protein